MLLPPPLVVVLAASPGASSSPPIPPLPDPHGWTSYLTPAATWDPSALPIVVGTLDAPALPGVDPAELDAALFVAARAWMAPSCTLAAFRVGATHAPKGDPSSLVADGTSDVVVHTTDWPAALEAGALAHTVVYLSGGRIVEADVHVNAKEWTFSVVPGGSGRDLRSVLTHELGHVLGIGHSEVARATMSAGLPAGLAGRTLEPDDVAAVCTLYPLTPPVAHGCDRDGVACPSGFVCVGHACERAGELGTLGAPCVSTSPRCDGASDSAWCLVTSSGERCVAPCPDAPDGCGAGLDCVPIDPEGHRACVPVGATVPGAHDAGADGAADAGVDAGVDGEGDASAGASSGGGGCRFSPAPYAKSPTFLLVAPFVVAALGRSRNRRRSRVDRGA